MAIIVNKEKKFLFFHIPKTAGTSIEAALATVAGSKRIDVSLTDKKKKKYLTASYAEDKLIGSSLSKLFRLDRHFTYKNLFKFCVVRDPLERALSAYKYCLKTANTNYIQPYGKKTPSDITFSEFIRLPPEFNYEIHNHFHISQSEYINGRFTQIDKFMKMENIENEFNILTSTLKISNLSLPKKNISENTPTNISHEDKELIKKIFYNDYKIFGYL